mgnify:CR=1 FL=1
MYQKNILCGCLHIIFGIKIYMGSALYVNWLKANAKLVNFQTHFKHMFCMQGGSAGVPGVPAGYVG